MPRRMSVWPVAIQTRTPLGIGITTDSAFKVAAITADGASAPIRTRTPFMSTSMTPGSEPFAGGNGGDAVAAASR